MTIMNLTLSTLIVFGQSRAVKGRLVSIEDQIPIPGYSVIEPGTPNGTVTDINGEFTLTINTRPSIILFPGCFDGLFVEYEEGVDFKEVVLGTDSRKGQNYKDSKKVERKFLRSRPTRILSGEVINKKNRKPVYNCEIRLKGTDNVIHTDAEGNFSITVPNNKAIEIEIRKGTSLQTAVYDLQDNYKKIKLRLREEI